MKKEIQAGTEAEQRTTAELSTSASVEANPMLSAVFWSATNYSCPNCGAMATEETFISQTLAEFKEEPDPHYCWQEIHKCQKCNIVYALHNGTYVCVLAMCRSYRSKK